MKINLTLNSNGLADRIVKTEGLGWLDKTPLPVMPDALRPMVHNYDEKKGINASVKVLPTNGQIWHQLTQDEKEQLLELVEYTGVRAEDYMRLWTSMLPKDPVRRK